MRNFKLNRLEDLDLINITTLSYDQACALLDFLNMVGRRAYKRSRAYRHLSNHNLIGVGKAFKEFKQLSNYANFFPEN